MLSGNVASGFQLRRAVLNGWLCLDGTANVERLTVAKGNLPLALSGNAGPGFPLQTVTL